MSATVVGLLLAACPISDAQAETWSSPDRARDVHAYSFDPDAQPCPTITSLEGRHDRVDDLRRLTVGHEADVVVLTATFRDLGARVAPITTFHPQTPDGAYQVTVSPEPRGRRPSTFWPGSRTTPSRAARVTWWPSWSPVVGAPVWKHRHPRRGTPSRRRSPAGACGDRPGCGWASTTSGSSGTSGSPTAGPATAAGRTASCRSTGRGSGPTPPEVGGGDNLSVLITRQVRAPLGSRSADGRRA